MFASSEQAGYECMGRTVQIRPRGPAFNLPAMLLIALHKNADSQVASKSGLRVDLTDCRKIEHH